jgi:SEC-C motif-containing protein
MSEKDYSQCCEPIIEGQKAETAEQLMRARYTAYSQTNMDFIEKTHDPKTLKNTDMKANREWAEQTKWKGLEILSTENGTASDNTGVVEFRAQYSDGTNESSHHEISEFIKRGDTWYFSKGKAPENFQIVNTEPKVGRNDPCPCGSGKKYKKCCA